MRYLNVVIAPIEQWRALVFNDRLHFINLILLGVSTFRNNKERQRVLSM